MGWVGGWGCPVAVNFIIMLDNFLLCGTFQIHIFHSTAVGSKYSGRVLTVISPCKISFTVVSFTCFSEFYILWLISQTVANFHRVRVFL